MRVNSILTCPRSAKPFAIVALALLLIAPTIRAQDHSAGKISWKISCHGKGSGYSQTANKPYQRKLWDGYEVSLGPARNAQGAGDDCTAAVYSAAGRVVFRTTGFSVIFDEKHTGQDFDGDGKPEVVFITDTGGGNHCCWAYNVVSLFPTPHKLFDIEQAGTVRFENDDHGKMIIWQHVPGPYGFTSMVRTPFAVKVFRVRGGKLSDATSEFCTRMYSDDNEAYGSWKASLTAENLKKLQSSGNRDMENEEIVSDLLSRALQHVFCHQFDAALDDLNLWPQIDRRKMKTEFAKSIEQDYPEFAAKLRARTNNADGTKE